MSIEAKVISWSTSYSMGVYSEGYPYSFGLGAADAEEENGIASVSSKAAASASQAFTEDQVGAAVPHKQENMRFTLNYMEAACLDWGNCLSHVSFTLQ